MKRNVLYLLIVLPMMAACSKQKTVTDEPSPIDTIPMLVTKVQKCSRLYTTEYHVHKILTHNDKMKVTGSILHKEFTVNIPAGDRRIAIPIDAVLKAYVDFDGFSEKNIRRENGHLTVILPDPKIVVTGTKVNHKEVKQFVALTRRNFTDAELTSYEQQGRQQIIASIPQMGIIEQARVSAARQLVPLFKAMGYKEENITISFRKKFDIGDLPSILDNSTVEKNGKDI